MASATSFQNGKRRGGRWDTLTRLPLQVGSTAHWSFTRVPLPVGIAIGLVVWLPQLATSDHITETRDVVGLVLLGLLAIACVAYSVFHFLGAVRMRASDLILASEGLVVEGGRGRSTRVRWDELAPPYAELEEARERQLSALGSILFVISLFRAGSPIVRVTVWKLWLYAGGNKRMVAKSDREIEARSMEAAAASVAAIQEGRRQVAEAPAVPMRGVFCPACGAPVAPRDAPEAPCAHCGGSVPMDAEARKQAAATETMKASRERVSKATARLLRQPRAAPTNRRLIALWALMVIPWPPALALFFYHQRRELDTTVFGLDVWLFWIAPLAVMFGAWALGRALLVSRGAFQLLTLGFGALAPAREGEPPRCRRCHGPLGDGGAGGVVQCGFCGSDNITGIDPRPFVDKARAEEQTLDRIVDERRRSRVSWSVAGAFGVLLMAAASALVVAGFAAIAG